MCAALVSVDSGHRWVVKKTRSARALRVRTMSLGRTAPRQSNPGRVYENARRESPAAFALSGRIGARPSPHPSPNQHPLTTFRPLPVHLYPTIGTNNWNKNWGHVNAAAFTARITVNHMNAAVDLASP